MDDQEIESDHGEEEGEEEEIEVMAVLLNERTDSLPRSWVWKIQSGEILQVLWKMTLRELFAIYLNRNSCFRAGHKLLDRIIDRTPSLAAHLTSVFSLF